MERRSFFAGLMYGEHGSVADTLGLLRIAAACLVALFGCLVLPLAASAFDGKTCLSSFRDITGENESRMLELDCAPGFATGHDRVLVYAINEPLAVRHDWWIAVDFVDELWVFDANADGSADLIVRFINDGASLSAELYDDQDGDAQVSYVVRDGVPTVMESAHWTVRAAASEGRWTENGRVNYNLHIEVDGQVDALWGSSAYLTSLMNDGRVDFTAEVRDTNGDGSPDYEIRQAYPPAELWYVPHTWLGVAEIPQAPPQVGGTFWPYLGSGHYGFFQQFNRYYAPIQVDWHQARIRTVVEFVPSHEGDDVWYVQSFAPFGTNSATYANFENPVGWYDLAGDRDGYPEMHIRFEHYGTEDREHWWYYRPSSVEKVRYSWDQDNDTSYDYKLDLLGRHPFTSTVTFQEFSVRTVPFREAPRWVAERSWDAAVFVAAGAKNYAEGIYDWSVIAHDLEQYVFGLTRQEPAPYSLDKLTTGFRGEYTRALGAQPYLYFSPVDRSLHLVGATAGVYKITDSQRMDYRDTDDDGYFDRWSLRENGVLVRSLLRANGYQVLWEAQEEILKIKKADAPASLFVTLPPRDTGEWRELTSKLPSPLHAPGSADPADMFAESGATSLVLTAATMQDARLTESGFRMVVQVDSASTLQSDFGAATQLLSEPGRFVLSGRDGVLEVRFASAPRLSVDASDIIIQGGLLRETEPARINVVIRNSGLEDALHVLLTAHLQSDAGFTDVVTQTIGFVPGEGESLAHLDWTPTQSGSWWGSLHVSSSSPELATEQTSASLRLDVMAGPELRWRGLLSLPLLDSDVSIFVIALMVSIGVLALVVAVRVSRQREKPAIDSRTKDMECVDS